MTNRLISSPARVSLSMHVATMALLSGMAAMLPATVIPSSAAAQAAPNNAGDDGHQDIIVTAHRRVTEADAVRAWTSVRATDLPAPASGGLGDALQALPSVRATHFGPNASRPLIRGFGEERVRLMSDGIEGVDASAASADHAVPIDGLEAQTIEVLRGPAALRYGSNAIGGAINVVSGRLIDNHGAGAGTATGGAMRVAYDSAINGVGVGINATRQFGATIVRIDGMVKENGDIAIPGDAYSAAYRAYLAGAGSSGPSVGVAAVSTHPLAASASPIIAAPEAPDVRNTITAAHSDTYGYGLGLARDIGVVHVALASRDLSMRYGVPAGEEGVHIDMGQTRTDLALSMDVENSALAQISLRSAYSDYHHDEVEADGAIGTQYRGYGTDTRLELELAKSRLGAFDHTGLLGLTLTDGHLGASGDETLVPGTDTKSTGIYALQGLQLGAVGWELGVRHDARDMRAEDGRSRSDNLTNLAVNMDMRVTPQLTLSVSATRAQRAPSATETYADGLHAATAAYEIGDETLTRETSNGGEFGVRWALMDWVLEGHVWGANFDGFIGFAPTGAEQDGAPVYQVAQADARLYGTELLARGPIGSAMGGDWDLALQADVTRGRFVGAGNLPLMPAPFVTATLSGHWYGASASLIVSHLAEQQQTAGFELPTKQASWADIQVRVPLRQYGDSAVVFSVSNINNAEIRDATSRLKDVLPRAGRGLRVMLVRSF